MFHDYLSRIFARVTVRSSTTASPWSLGTPRCSRELSQQSKGPELSLIPKNPKFMCLFFISTARTQSQRSHKCCPRVCCLFVLHIPYFIKYQRTLTKLPLNSSWKANSRRSNITHSMTTPIQMLHWRNSSDAKVAGSGGTSFMSRSQLGPWPPSFQRRAWGSARTGSPEETGPGSLGFCAAPPGRGPGQSGPNLVWTGTAPARTCSSPRMKEGIGTPAAKHTLCTASLQNSSFSHFCMWLLGRHRLVFKVDSYHQLLDELPWYPGQISKVQEQITMNLLILFLAHSLADSKYSWGWRCVWQEKVWLEMCHSGHHTESKTLWFSQQHGSWPGFKTKKYTEYTRMTKKKISTFTIMPDFLKWLTYYIYFLKTEDTCKWRLS